MGYPATYQTFLTCASFKVQFAPDRTFRSKQTSDSDESTIVITIVITDCYTVMIFRRGMKCIRLIMLCSPFFCWFILIRENHQRQATVRFRVTHTTLSVALDSTITSSGSWWMRCSITLVSKRNSECPGVSTFLIS